jgi:putative ABC transport system permease protein
METIRNLTRRKLRSSLTISGILIGILALTTMGAMAEDVNALLSGGETWFGSSIQVAATGSGYSLLSLDKANELLSVPGVEAVTPSITANAQPGDNGGISFGPGPTIAVWDPNINRYSAFQLSFASGHALADGSRGGVVLGTTLASTWHLQVGDGVDLPRRPSSPPPGFTQHHFTVAGILAKTQTAPDDFAWVTLPDAQMFLADNLPQAVQGRVDVSTLTQGFSVYAARGTSLAGMDAIAQRIGDQVPGVRASKPSQIVSSFKSGSAIFTAITTGAALLALIIGGLSVINTMLMAVSERVREIGLKKAVGARTRHILREFLAESVLIGAIGGTVGYGLGVAATTALNLALGPANQLFLVTPELTALALGFAVLIGAVAGVIPAWRAAAMDPVAALRAQ